MRNADDRLRRAGPRRLDPRVGRRTRREDPDRLGATLVDFFSGRLELEPRISTVPWSEVADAVERRLVEVVERSRDR